MEEGVDDGPGERDEARARVEGEVAAHSREGCGRSVEEKGEEDNVKAEDQPDEVAQQRREERKDWIDAEVETAASFDAAELTEAVEEERAGSGMIVRRLGLADRLCCASQRRRP